ncbi:Aromatic amino acid transport protein AroP [compost metagenome]
MQAKGVEASFKAFWFPLSNYICLAFVLFILGVMLLIPGIQVSVYAMPFWVLFIWICYRLKLAASRQG